MTAQHPFHDAGQMRLAGGVMAAAMVLWLAANWAGQRFGWAPEYAFLADLAAIGALVWALLVTWRVWRRGRAAEVAPTTGPATGPAPAQDKRRAGGAAAPRGSRPRNG